MKKNINISSIEEFDIFVQAIDNYMQGDFQWYIMDDPNEGAEHIIEGEVHNTIYLSSKEIGEKYKDKYLACHCKVQGEKYNEGCVYLTDSFVEIMTKNQFNKITLGKLGGSNAEIIKSQNSLDFISEPFRLELLEMRLELNNYKDLEENGLLKIFPCHAKDSVFVICGREEQHGKEKVYVEYVAESIVDSFVVGDSGIPQAWVDIDGEWSLFDCKSDFGKTIFLTKEAAQAAIDGEKENRKRREG